MVAIDDTLEDLELLYHFIGGSDNYEIWDETVGGAGLDETVREIESVDERQLERQRVVDYWNGLNQAGLLDSSWQLTDLGENWKSRTMSAVQSLYSNGAGIGDERRSLGDIFYTLGSKDVLPVMHVFYNNLEPADHLEGVNIAEPAEVMYNHDFINTEPFRKTDWQPGKEILTERGNIVYEEIVEPDYWWMKNSDYEL